MITRLQSTVAIEELEFATLTPFKQQIGTVGSDDTKPVNMTISGSEQLQFQTQSILL